MECLFCKLLALDIQVNVLIIFQQVIAFITRINKVFKGQSDEKTESGNEDGSKAKKKKK